MTTGIILAGGRGTRLAPATNHTNKHMLLVYDREMIRYPAETLVQAGITDLVVVLGPGGSALVDVLEDGSWLKGLGLESLVYVHQGEPLGTAHSVQCAEQAVRTEDVVVILGDSFFGGSLRHAYETWQENPHGALLITVMSDYPEKYGRVVTQKGYIWEIKEKVSGPPVPGEVSTGCCFLDNEIWGYLKGLDPSPRGELEFPDALQKYMVRNHLRAFQYDGFWTDMGTPEGVFDVALVMHNLPGKNG